MDVAITGGSPNRDIITDYGGWGSVNIKDRHYNYLQEKALQGTSLTLHHDKKW